MADVEIRVTGREAAETVHRQIPEFDEDHIAERYGSKCRDNDPLHLVAEIDGDAVGYAVCYDKFDDGSYYIWMAGVAPEERRQGVMTRLLDEITEKARSRGYSSLKVKTRNERNAMQHLLIDKGFNVCGYNPKETTARSEILYEKEV